MRQVTQDEIRFGPFRISRSERLLRRGDEAVPLPPKAVETLLALAEVPGRVVEKKELLDRVWPDTFVEEGGLARNISQLRKTLGTDIAGKHFIETIPRRGYRFVAPVTFDSMENAAMRSIAVLPLRSLSGDPADEFFADGMTDALIGRFSRIGALRVASRTAVMRWKGVGAAPRELARELDVELLLEGTVLLADGRVRIAVSLLNGSDAQQIWSSEYEREMRDVLALGSDLARDIAREIRVTLSAPEQAAMKQARPVDPEAYREYLRGRQFWSQRTRESLQQALLCFRSAIAHDPEDAAAHAGLAETYALLGSIGYDGMPPHAAMPIARQAALEALRLQPELAEAHSALGIVKLLYDWDFAGAEAALESALIFNPACLAAHQWQGELELARARPELAATAFSRGAALDPFSIPCQLGLGWSYYFARRYEQAISQFRRTLELAPGLPMALYGLGLSFHHHGDFEQALGIVREAESSSGGEPASVMLLATTATLLGNAAESSVQLERLRAMLPQRYVPPVYFAFIHAMRNELDDAFDWLERAFDERSSYLIFLRLQPALHNLRADSRYFALVRRVGV